MKPAGWPAGWWDRSCNSRLQGCSGPVAGVSPLMCKAGPGDCIDPLVDEVKSGVSAQDLDLVI